METEWLRRYIALGLKIGRTPFIGDVSPEFIMHTEIIFIRPI